MQWLVEFEDSNVSTQLHCSNAKFCFFFFYLIILLNESGNIERFLSTKAGRPGKRGTHGNSILTKQYFYSTTM